MPIYEFQCGSCGERFEDLVAAGTSAPPCPRCGAETERVLSVTAPTHNLALSPGSARKQERKNAELRGRAKADFKQRLAQRRRAQRGGGGS